MKPRRWPARLRRLAVVLLIGAALWWFRAPILTGAASFLDVSEPVRKVDYVFVLGGDNETRPFLAASLVNAGWARGVLVASQEISRDAVEGLVPPEQEIIRRVLIARGVPSDAILLLPGQVNSTRDEAVALAAFLHERPDSSVGVVTNGYHTRRARMILRRVLGEHITNVSFVAAPTYGYHESNWWLTERGFIQYMSEFVKLGLQTFGS